jgi:hypothetical protein
MRQNGVTREQASTLAARHFPACEAHRREAAAIYLALDRMHPTSLHQLNIDMTIGELLPQLMSSRRPALDSLEAIELQMAVEEELDPRDLAKLAVAQVAEESVMQALLGAAAENSKWDARTIWVRSVRGVINERVRHADDCACAEAPSNNEMQRTRHG